MKLVRISLVAAAMVVMGGLAAAEKVYDTGASDTEIRIGNANPYSGKASAYGAIGKTIGAYFDKVNAAGGINGRKLTFITLDDAYNPSKTVEQVRRLVEQDGVLLVFQTLGTPSNLAIQKYLNQKQVPQLFVATGATRWNDPKNFPWTMGWQPNYQTEARIYARYILANVENPKIGVLYQNDDYGKDYLKGLRDGLGDKAKDAIALEASYETSDATIDSQIVQLQASGANVFINVATPKWATQAIKKASDIGWKPLHFLNNVSNSIPAVLTPAGLDKASGIISSLYVKVPGDPSWKDDAAMQAYLAFMKQYNAEANPDDALNAYGYAVSQTLEQVLKQAGDDLTRANIMKQAASLKGFTIPMLLPGIVIDTSDTDYAPIEQMQPVRFDGEKWVPLGPVMSGASVD